MLLLELGARERLRHEVYDARVVFVRRVAGDVQHHRVPVAESV